MTETDAIAYFHSLLKFGITPGLEPIRALCERLGNPQDTLRFVHIAGTNGKGSTAAMLAGILRAAGYKTGLYTSPYVLHFRERIQVDGEMIPPEALAAVAEQIQAEDAPLRARGIGFTEFDAITAAAFLYFRQARCDVVVLETGLGGRLDSTNCIATPLASVLTSISMDHMAVLGDSLSEIAAEKCGILKPGGIALCYPEQPEEALQVVRERAAALGNPLVLPNLNAVSVLGEEITGSEISYGKLRLTVPFPGRHMVQNAVLAAETVGALRIRGLRISDAAIEVGIAGAKMPARMETLRKNPLVLLDGGHNEGCARALAALLERFLPGRPITAVCAMMADKDAAAYLRLLAPRLSGMIATTLPMERAMPAESLAEVAKSCGLPCEVIPDAREAYGAALARTPPEGAVVVCGSFYLASELRSEILAGGLLATINNYFPYPQLGRSILKEGRANGENVFSLF